MKLLISIVLFFPSLFLLDNTSITQQVLTGKWTWVNSQTIDRRGSTTETPQSCNCTKMLIFKNDTLTYYKDVILVSDENYSLREIQFLNDPIAVMIDNEVFSGEIKMQGDSMGIGPFGGCGTIHWFKKLK